ncbi:hypothetical protein [Vulcanisaeta souniana]|uniref:Uncharacterized protein n=1 Tax=Vulcanisaeta souniana JCM 11219 TaxID=1293586 RepID=A0A830DXV8_9CREN|nr:hypothetical protein [Vulcanisaeta souniana]BDR92183.1 hypothetical protein Vsou_12760 [Vulcanisaeta souniana JCM 11219]GGI67299.1 hypothetical protein GCM10007112_00330 [Vulcanisaeta souniana JCM 11219]
MSEWSWESNDVEWSIDRYSTGIVISLLLLVLYLVIIIVTIITLLPNAEGNQLIALSIITSMVITALLTLIIYSYTRIKSIRKAITNLRKVEIKVDSIILDTINGTYAAKPNEITICYKAITGRDFRPYAYNVFINYQGTTYQIPDLKPEDYGALRQVLKGHGIDVNECQAQ